MSKLIKGKVLGWAHIANAHSGRRFWYPLIWEDSRARYVQFPATGDRQFIAHQAIGINWGIGHARPTRDAWTVTDASTGLCLPVEADTLNLAMWRAGFVLAGYGHTLPDASAKSIKLTGCPPEVAA